MATVWTTHVCNGTLFLILVVPRNFASQVSYQMSWAYGLRIPFTDTQAGVLHSTTFRAYQPHLANINDVSKATGSDLEVT